MQADALGRVVRHPLHHLRLLFLELRQGGLRAAWRKAWRTLRHPYTYACALEREDALRALEAFDPRPRFSVLMPVHNIAARWLNAAVDSVRNQFYPDWELCIVDDGSTRPETREALAALDDTRIRVQRLETGRGISGASNAALAMATGEYVVLLDHDDELTPDALFRVAEHLQRRPADVLYSDEDVISERGVALKAHFKPDYSPDLLLAHNYITHLLSARRELVDTVGGFRSAYDGAQDYDLVLRLVEKSDRVEHIPHVLYHWRSLSTSTSRSTKAKPFTVDAGIRALRETLRRRGIDARVSSGNLPNFYRVRRVLLHEPPVSVVIPFRDRPELLRRCMDALLARSTYRHLEILCVDNGSTDPVVAALLEDSRRRDDRIRVLPAPGPFNYAAINNRAVEEARGTYVVLMNNDIRVITRDWVEALLEHAQRPEVGAVGGKLYYPDGRVQHAGVIVGIAGHAGHAHRGLRGNDNGYFNRLQVTQNVSAVTGALLMVRRALYRDIGGLDAEHLPLAFNDVDFCLRLRERGLLNVFTPYCEAWHDESVSRGYEESPEQQARFEAERRYLRERHRGVLEVGDPYYNPNLSLEAEDFRYADPALRLR